MNLRDYVRKMLLESMALSESQTLYIQNYDYGNSFKNVSDVLSYMEQAARKHIEEVIGDAQTQQYVIPHKTFAYDGGTSPYSEEGTINLYLYNEMPYDLAIHISNFLQRDLLNKGIKIRLSKIEPSGSMNVPVIRLHVVRIEDAQDEPEMVNLSNENARYIFTHVLNYSEREYEHAQFDVKDFRIRIEFAKQNMGLHDKPAMDNRGPNYYGRGYDQKDILRRLQDFDEFALFALQKGYQKIYIA